MFEYSVSGLDATSMTAEEIIDRFNLKPLPHEGGYFTEVYQDSENRSQSSIYYLITEEGFSALHRLKIV
ncbi:MAG: cupin domain-containing protein [Proteobacteria bacterium]|nr:cupin domain-containing protein [Pseudomonadota bacterium]